MFLRQIFDPYLSQYAYLIGCQKTGEAIVIDPERDQRLKTDPVENPNAAILAELSRLGVQIELCEDTMRQRGVAAAELMPGVKMVVGAFPRLIDLQLQGFAYIKFE